MADAGKTPKPPSTRSSAHSNSPTGKLSLNGWLRRAYRVSGNIYARMRNDTAELRKFGTNLSLVVAALLVITVIVIETKRKQIIVEPLSVPETLEEVGISGEVAARWIRDEIKTVQIRAGTALEGNLFVSDDELPDIAISGSAFSLRSIVDLAKALFGASSPRISGEIIVLHGASLGSALRAACRNASADAAAVLFEIRIRAQSDQKEYWTQCGRDIKLLTEVAAQQVVRRSNPYILASYFYGIGQTKDDPESTERAKKLANLVLIERPEKEHPWALNLLGLIRSNEKDYEGGIEHFKEIERRKFSFALGYINWGNTERKRGRPKEAIKQYEKAIKRGPDAYDALAYFSWGELEYDREKFNEAIKKYEMAIGRDENFAHAYNSWGLALHKLGRYDETIDKYKKAVEKDPDFALALFNWGRELGRRGSDGDAVRMYEIAIDRNSDYADADAYNSWGEALQNLNRYKEAIDKYKQAINHDPDFAFAYNNWGTALANLGDFDGAIDKFKMAIDRDPKFFLAYDNLHDTLKFRKRNEEATAVFAYRKCVQSPRPLTDCQKPEID
jgi:tetratricopeptide (TPR) repeat protein